MPVVAAPSTNNERTRNNYGYCNIYLQHITGQTLLFGVDAAELGANVLP